MGYTRNMNKKIITNRLRRAAGQTLKLADSIENGQACRTVLVQLLAVRGAINGAIKAYVSLSVDECKRKTQAVEMADLLKFIVNKS